MRMCLCASLIALALTASPAVARPYVLNLGGTYVPEAGHGEFIHYRFNAPIGLQTVGSRLGPLEEGVHWAESWSYLELGLGYGASASVVLPVDRLQSFSGGAPVLGLADMTVMTSHRLWKNEANAGRLRFRVDLPTGASGVGSGRTTLGIQHSQSYDLAARWKGYLNLNYYHALPQRLDGATHWAGQRVQFHSALEYMPVPNVGLILEQLGQISSRASIDGTPQAESGSLLIQLAPGITWMAWPNLALQAGVVVPVYWQGYQMVAPWNTVLGVVVDF